MAIEPVYENLTLCGKQGAVCDRIKVECKTDIPVGLISKIINVSASTVIKESQTKNGEIKYGGTVSFFVCYQDLEGDLKKAECTADFNGSIKADFVVEENNVELSVVSEKTQADTSGVKLELACGLSVCAVVYGENNFSALVGGESLVTDLKNLTLYKDLGKIKSNYPVEEEFELNCEIEEVLFQNAQAYVTTVQCGVGSVIIDGEVIFHAILLQSGEKNDIIRETKRVPYRAEIECEGATPTCNATAIVKKRSFKTDITVDEESAKSLVNLSVLLEFSCRAYTEEEIMLVRDAFSTSENVKVEREKITCFKNLEQRSCTSRVLCRVKLPESAEGATLIAVCGERTETVSFESCEEGTKVLGTIEITAILKDAEGKIFSEKLESSFETVIDCLFEEDVETEIFSLVENASLQLITLSEAEIQADVVFTIYPKKRCNIEYIYKVESCGEREVIDSAISVFIPLEGEELWPLAKRLGVSPDELMQINSDLQFPLSGEERIVIYRQK